MNYSGSVSDSMRLADSDQACLLDKEVAMDGFALDHEASAKMMLFLQQKTGIVIFIFYNK